MSQKSGAKANEPDIDLDYARDQARLWANKWGLDDDDIEDIAAESCKKLLKEQKKEKKIQTPRTYLATIVQHEAIRLLRERNPHHRALAGAEGKRIIIHSSHKIIPHKAGGDWLDGDTGAAVIADEPEIDEPDEAEPVRKSEKSPQVEFEENEAKELYIRRKQSLEERIEISIELVELLYFLKKNLHAAETFIVPVSRSINALKGAKKTIDDLAAQMPTFTTKRLEKICGDLPLDPKPLPGEAAVSRRRKHQGISPYPQELKRFSDGAYFSYVDTIIVIRGILDKLSQEIEDLEKKRAHKMAAWPGACLGDLFSWRLEDFSLDDPILDAIPQLRADPIMLVLRILYKVFKIGSGQYGAREVIRERMLKLKAERKGSSQEFIFSSFDKATNFETHFETLRKKIYSKAGNRLKIYDELADRIYSFCFGGQV